MTRSFRDVKCSWYSLNCFEMPRTSIAAAISELLREVRLRATEHAHRDSQRDERDCERVPEVRDITPIGPVRKQRRGGLHAVDGVHIVEARIDRALEDEHDRGDRISEPRPFRPAIA